MTDRPVLVLGHHRSGTTWLASVLGAADGHQALPGELSNPHAGFRLGGQDLPPYARPEDVDLPATLAALRGLRTRPHRSLYSRRDRRHWLPPRRWRRTPVLKDPLGARLAPVLADALDARPVVVVRHPAAIYHSLLRVGWLASVPRLADEPQSDLVGEFIASWCVVYGSLLGSARERGWPVVRHGDLAAAPRAAFPALFDQLGVPYDGAARAWLEESTTDAVTTPTDGQVHQLRRDSRQLVDAWRDDLDADVVARIVAGTSDLLGSVA